MKQVIWYSSSDCEEPSRYELALPRGYHIMNKTDQGKLAELCADDFHSNHDGWESRWPRDITIYETEEGPPIASFEVDREAIPHFYVHRKAKAT